eukprot:6399369-Pyramimonas_sp.AAC.2
MCIRRPGYLEGSPCYAGGSCSDEGLRRTLHEKYAYYSTEAHVTRILQTRPEPHGASGKPRCLAQVLSEGNANTRTRTRVTDTIWLQKLHIQ